MGNTKSNNVDRWAKIHSLEKKTLRIDGLPVIVYTNGKQIFYENGELHTDGNGLYFWHNKEGKLHRDNDLPAIIDRDGNHYWYQDGKLHRNNDLPAVIYVSDNTLLWYKEGVPYRDNDLPTAVTTREGEEIKTWYNKEGKFHRDNNLPAVMRKNIVQWYVNGEFIGEMTRKKYDKLLSSNTVICKK